MWSAAPAVKVDYPFPIVIPFLLRRLISFRSHIVLYFRASVTDHGHAVL